MFSHIMVGSNDIDRSQRFYDALLSVFGAKPAMRNAAGTGHMRLFISSRWKYVLRQRADRRSARLRR